MNFARKNILLIALIVLVLVSLYKIFSIGIKEGAGHLVTLLPTPEVHCPEHVRTTAILVLGQSQGANTGEARTIARSPNSFMFQDGKCWHLQDPVKGTPDRGGSIWPAFADSYARPVIVSNLSVSGSSIKLWVTSEKIALIHRSLEDLRRLGYNPVIIWMNGETDSAAGMTADEYLKYLNVLGHEFAESRWFITRESRCYDKQSKYRPLDEARDHFVSFQPTLRKMGPDLDKVPVSLRQPDGCHLNRDGQRGFGTLMGVAFAEAFGT